MFEDANGVGWNVSVSHNPGLRRYVLSTEHTETHAGKLGIFDAPEPWGPWSTVAYDEAWGAGHIEVSTFYWNFTPKPCRVFPSRSGPSASDGPTLHCIVAKAAVRDGITLSAKRSRPGSRETYS